MKKDELFNGYSLKIIFSEHWGILVKLNSSSVPESLCQKIQLDFNLLLNEITPTLKSLFSQTLKSWLMRPDCIVLDNEYSVMLEILHDSSVLLFGWWFFVVYFMDSESWNGLGYLNLSRQCLIQWKWLKFLVISQGVHKRFCKYYYSCDSSLKTVVHTYGYCQKMMTWIRYDYEAGDIFVC